MYLAKRFALALLVFLALLVATVYAIAFAMRLWAARSDHAVGIAIVFPGSLVDLAIVGIVLVVLAWAAARISGRFVRPSADV